MGIVLGLAGYLGYNMSELNQAQGKYNSTVVLPATTLFYPTYMQLQTNHSHLQSAESHAITAAGILAALWLWNIIDAGAFTDIPKQDFFSFRVHPRTVSDPMSAVATRQVEQYGYVNYNWRF